MSVNNPLEPTDPYFVPNDAVDPDFLNQEEAAGERFTENPYPHTPTEADFEDILTPEGDSGEVMGSDVSGGVGITNDSIGGTMGV